MFTGGLPEDQEDEHNALTVIQGADHIALDFTSAIIDFIPVTGRWDIHSLFTVLVHRNFYPILFCPGQAPFPDCVFTTNKLTN